MSERIAHLELNITTNFFQLIHFVMDLWKYSIYLGYYFKS